MDTGEFKKALVGKVDKVELEAVINMKSNKHDTDIAMKGIDILHKQVTHLVVLVVELVKLVMNQLSLISDSEKTKHHKSLMYLLQQGVNVCRWVSEFDPQNVNLVDLVLPSDLEQLNEYSHILIKEFPKLDTVAELALRKFKARGGAGGGASGQVPLTAETASTVAPRASSPGKGSAERQEKELLPSQQLDKYIATTLNSQRKLKGQRVLGKAGRGQQVPSTARGNVAVASGSMSFNNGNVILGLQMPPSQTMYNNAFNNLRGINMNSR